MSKFLNVPNGDYKVSVKTGGTIYLDTGFEIGASVQWTFGTATENVTVKIPNA
jgi:hypothetical protein